MKVRIRRLLAKPSIDGAHSRKHNKVLLKLEKHSLKTREQKVRDEKDERKAKAKSARISLYPPGTVLNAIGTRAGMNTTLTSEDARKLIGMRKFYNKKIPTYACDTCQLSSLCPMAKPGYECAFTPILNSHHDSLESETDVRRAMRNLVEANMSRLQFALVGERVTGAKPSLELTEASALMFQQLEKLREVEAKADTEIEIEGDGGIIGQLFGSLASLASSTKSARAKPIFADDATPVEKRSKNGKHVPETLQLVNGEIPPGVDLDLVNEYSTDQLISRRRDKKAKPGRVSIHVSTVS